MSARPNFRTFGLAASLAASACAGALGCTPDTEGPSELHARESGGSATVFDTTRDAFSLPVPTLTTQHRASFFVGNSFFNQNWVSAPSTVDMRDGLGPLFNARSCSACHFKDGRGAPPDPGQSPIALVLRISLRGGGGPHGAPRPDPVYGDQIQTDALPGLPREAAVAIDYSERTERSPDGESYALRTPAVRLSQLGYGGLQANLETSARVAPALIGLGLLEAVPEADILSRVDAGDRDGDGISGRDNRVWDAARGDLALGRFGWKAEQPSVRQQVAVAFQTDMGITSSLLPDENHTSQQPACADRPGGGTPEVSDAILEDVGRYASTLGVPARRNLDDPRVRRGARLFQRAGCTGCHRPSLQSGAVADLPELGGQVIHPFTDLLLHDMGEGLADHRPAFAADGREWRTAPLWGIGLVGKVNGHGFFLHDGRARGLQEAVLWHGGEARAAQRAFLRMTQGERRDLIAFIESL
jgi:CxxC motif-containing protein (DUF1111 family)